MLQTKNKDYILSQLNLKQTIELGLISKNQSPFHTQLQHKNSLYLHAWPDSCAVLKLQNHPQKNEKIQSHTHLKIDKDSFIKQKIFDYTQCHGSTMINNEIHFFVSKNQSKLQSSTDLQIIKLNLATGVYSRVLTSGEMPSLRSVPLIQAISNMYVVVYGGVNKKDNLPCSDAYALIFWEWNKLKIVNPIQPRTHFASTTINAKIYLHGGQLILNDQKTYLSDLYELTFSDTKKQLIFQEIRYSVGPSPSPRSNHKITAISSRHLLIFGGNTQYKTNQGPQVIITLKDFWMFDLVQKKWQEITIDFQKINYHSLYGFSTHLNELYIFGAFQNNKSNKKVDLIKLQFVQKIDKKPLQSSHQQMLTTKGKQKFQGTNIEFATSLIHNTSYLIRSPFQAFQRIIEFAQNQNADTIRIYSEMTTNTIQKYIYISIDIKTTEDIQLSSDFEVEVQKLFVYCLRMGKTALYVQNNKKTSQKNVYLMSADGRFAPLVQRLQLFYNYTEISNNSGLLSVENSRNKQTIHTILQGLIENPQRAIISIEGSKIMIFSPNIIPTPKSYFYELVFDSLLDISLFKNNKKLELLDKVKYDLANSMEFSLNSYIKYSNTNKMKDKKTKAQIFLSKSPNPVAQDKSYASYLEQFKKQGNLVRVKFPPNSNIKHTDSYDLYACEQDFYLPENNGILLYQNGQLINRYDCEFGNLLQNKFYHKKIFNHAKNVFIIVGQIHLQSKLNLVNFKTEFQKTNKFIDFQLSLQSLISDFLQKMQPAGQTKKVKSKEARNTENQHVSEDLKEDSLGQVKPNQGLVIKKQSGLSNPEGDQSEEEQWQDNDKKLKLDDEVENIEEK